MNIGRIRIGRWHFSYSFGAYSFGIRRDSTGAGSIGFGCGMLTYLRKGKYQPLPRGAAFTSHLYSAPSSPNGL